MNERAARRLVSERSGGLCERCGNVSRGVTLHHRIKRSHLHKSRQWDVVNCIMLCGDGTTPGGCHSWVEHHPNAAEDEGFHVRPWNNPAEIPIRSWRGTVYLTAVPDVPTPQCGTTATSPTPHVATYAEADKNDPWS